ncbi:hypothetical protein [Halorarius halobius]|uniref:DUF5789 family protein n=1 Tax=Halorarius halobius TaxID=2962671 RepID=UPI0020CD10F7|nr:hypothetical protein [Halorarius halobius]
MSDRDPQESARERQRKRAEQVEHVLESAQADLEGAYPANSDDLVAQYRSSESDLVNETETLADALDRLADEYDEFDSPAAARDALTDELERAEEYDEAFTDDVRE